jgi:hypothetical protein
MWLTEIDVQNGDFRFSDAYQKAIRHARLE